MRLLRLLASALILLIFASSSFAATYYIVKDGSGADDKIRYSTSKFDSSGTSTTLNTFFSGTSPTLNDDDEIYIAKGNIYINRHTSNE